MRFTELTYPLFKRHIPVNCLLELVSETFEGGCPKIRKFVDGAASFYKQNFLNILKIICSLFPNAGKILYMCYQIVKSVKNVLEKI